jgi:hypothetical protein
MAQDDGKKRKQWQVPTYSQSGSNKKEVHAWMKQNVDDGTEFLEASPGYQQLEESIRILSGKPSAALAAKQDEGYSRLNVNRLKRNMREMVNALSEIRYNPGYNSKNNELKPAAEMLNQYGNYWYIDRFIDLKVKKAIQWTAICPCGYLEICYRRFPGDHGKADIDAIPYSFFDVVMTGVPESGDHQEAYTVTIIKDLPVYLAHATWPEHTRILIPDRETPKGWMERVREKARKVVSDVFATEPEKSTAKNPTCRLYYQYVLDLSINRSGQTMKMGYEKTKINGQEVEVKTPWSYDVPSLGSMVLRGHRQNESTRQMEPYYTAAQHDECRIFPGRRLLVGNDQDLIYDGPKFDWYGGVPLIKFVADQWPVGEYSMMYDCTSIHDTLNEFYRVAHQTMRNRFDPTILYNERAIQKSKANALRADIQGARVGYNGGEVADAQKAVSPLFSSSFNTIEGWMEKFREVLTEEEDFISGRPNFAALSKMKMAVSSDNTENVLNEAGPIVKGISRDMERAMRDFADMFKYMVLQYKRVPELLYTVGIDMMTPVSFDFQPGNLIPSHLPGENKSFDSVYTEMQRARWVADFIPFLMMPGTMHEIVQTQQKMIYMQLWAKGYPIDPMTLGEVLRLGNVGTIKGSTMIERWFEWKKMLIEMEVALRNMAQAEAGEGGQNPNAQNMGPKGGAKGSGGRAPSGGAAPQVKAKGDGRVVTTESK